jgi:murein DD-endopeptidase MepM/ murein hydrolase activator NlpD
MRRLLVLVFAAACGVEYRPGDGHTDSAHVDGAHVSATRDTVVRVDTLVRVDTVRLARDSLTGLDPSAGGDSVAASPAPSAPAASDLDALRARHLLVPVQGVAASALHDNFVEQRGGGRAHEALDIMAPRGTPVLSADDGRVAKLFTSKAGGLTVYVASPDGRYMLYYAHLDHYRAGLAEGATVRKGDVLGYVGSTGDASPDAPHLHFAIARVADPKQWWGGTPIDPYPVLAPSPSAR